MDLDSSFVSGGDKVFLEDSNFENDYSLSSFLNSGGAALIYLRYFLLPFMAKYSEADCVCTPEKPPEEGSQRSKDFAVQMANDGKPSQGTNGGASDGDAACPEEEAQWAAE